MVIRATSLLLCNHVYEDPDSHNVSILGVFTTLRSTKFPTPYRVINVYALLAGEPGEVGELVFQCESDTGELIAEETRGVLLGSLGKRHLQVRLDELRFPEPGKYRFTLMAEGKIVGEQSFLVEEKP